MLTLEEHTTLVELRKKLMSEVEDYEDELNEIQGELDSGDLLDEEYDVYYDNRNDLEDALENLNSVIDHLTEIIFIAESC